MAHGVKAIKIEQQDELLECNNNQQCVNSSSISKLALNNLLLDNCCSTSSSHQSLISQKNSSTNTAVTSVMISTHQLLPPTHSASTLMNSSIISASNGNGNKLSLNCGGAPLSAPSKSSPTTSSSSSTGTTKMGSRRIFTPQFKLQVLESYRNDSDCKGNQRATARKYGIHRRQIQKWLQCEDNLRSIIANNPANVKPNAVKMHQKAAPILSSSTAAAQSSSVRHRGVVVGANTDKSGATYSCFTLANAKSYKSAVGSSKSLLTPSSSSSSSSSFADYSSMSNSNNATVIESNSRNNNFNFSSCYDNSAAAARLMFSIHHQQQHQYQQPTEKVEDLPIDLSCNSRIVAAIKSEHVARPIALHPSSVDYKIPFLRQQQQQHYVNSPRLTDISPSPGLVTVKIEPRGSDPIDLSVANVSHKRKLSTDNADKADKKPVKLFRPYLEESFDSHKERLHQHDDDASLQKFPLIYANSPPSFFYHPHDDFHQHQHPFLMSARSPTAMFYAATPSPVLQSPNESSTSFQTTTTLMPPSQASPVSGYGSSTSSIYSYNENDADHSQGSSPHYTSSHYDAPSPISSATMSPTTETKVPLLLTPTFLHDLKFKLHALDCYYNDEECKGNEKLVAHKLNINCKIVEKWLRQETDLRHQQKQYHLDILV